MAKNLKIFFVHRWDAQTSLLFPMSRRFYYQSGLLHQILDVWMKINASFLGQLPAGAPSFVACEYFLPEAREGCQKNANVRRGSFGSLDRFSAFGIPAGVTDGEAEDNGHAESSEMTCLVQSRSVMKSVRRYVMSQKTALPMSRVLPPRFHCPCAKP